MNPSVSLRRSFLLTVVAALLASVGAYASPAPRQAGQAPARDQAPPAAQEMTGTGRITVLVVASDTGAPVKRVQLGIYGMVGTPVPGGGVQTSNPPGGTAFVTISGSVGSGPSGPGRVQKEAETDENGRAEFTSLPPGAYSVMVRSSPAGFVRPNSSQSIPIKDGEAGSQTIRLLRGGAIMGRIVDETGDPLSRVSVRAVAKDAGNGMPRLASPGMPANTDDRGQFRIFDLPPGDYYVSASLFTQSMGDPASSQRAEPKIGYLPTFYPGAPGLDGAQAVGVKSGQETAGIDFGMLRGRLGRITGTALDSNGAPFPTRGFSIMLSPRSREMASPGRGASVRPDGTFVIPDIPPGDYYLMATAYDTASATGGGIVSTREGAVLPVTVGGDELVVDIRTNRGATLSGRVVREGPMPPPPVLPGATSRMPPPQAMRVSVGVRPPSTAGMTMGFEPGKSDYFEADGTFQIKGARGSVMITASSGVGVVKSIRSGAKDLLGVPLELTGTEAIDDIEIVLTTDTGSLMGTVTDRRGQPAPGAWVLVFPDDPKRWSQPFVSVTRTMTAAAVTALSQAPGAAGSPAPAAGGNPPSAAVPGAGTRPRAPGQFTVARLLPGRYLVAALDDTGTYPSPDPDLLASVRAKASTVTIVSGEPATVELRTVVRD